LKDKQRTGAYRDAILNNPSDFRDKVVLDVGSGTCILSMFCVQAGAKKVYAVDASDVADLGKKVVDHNKMGDKIEVLKGRIEEVEIPEKVDVIVSEWMGYFLLYESMFESVLYARKKFLKPGGKMYPSKAQMYFAPFSDEDYVDEKINFWKDVYGFDYTCIMHQAVEMNFEEPQTEAIAIENVLTFPAMIKSIDCTTVGSWDELKDFSVPFTFKTIISGTFHGFVGWFDVVFEGSDTSVTLSTSPESGYTHWRQTLFLFNQPVPTQQDDPISGTVHIKASTNNKRFFKIEIDCKIKDVQLSKKFELK